MKGKPVRTGRPAKEYSQAARLIGLYRRMSAIEGLTIRQAADEFGVSVRTIQRDFDALQEAMVPLVDEMSDGGEKMWRLMPLAREGVLRLNTGQMFSLYLASLLFEDFRGTQLWEDLAQLSEKLKTGLAENDKYNLEQLSRKIFVVRDSPRDYRRSDDVYNEVVTGLLRNQKVAIHYQNPHAKRLKKHVVHPYTLLNFKSGLYLVAYTDRADSVGTFAIERIRRAEWLRGQDFDYPDDYDPRIHLNGAFGLIRGDPQMVVLSMDPALKQYLKSRQWHPTQKLSVPREGRITLTMEVAPTVELESWILGFGAAVEVISPKPLREKVKSRLKAALKNY